jgi:fatty-acyl-CoA synthase
VEGRGEEVDDAALAGRAASLEADDPINIQFTSGTTGFPKPVVLTHHNILNNGWFAGEVLGLTERDRLCVPVPFYHCFGMVVSNLACLARGAAIVVPAPHFEAGATLAAIEQERCTAVHGVPTMFVAELESPDFARRDLRSLRTGIMAGAPCPPELVRRVIEEMGCRELLIGYGETEASPITHLTRPLDSFERRVRTVGTNLPHQEVKVVDPGTGALLPVGAQGEVCFRGYHVMRGYFGQQEATRAAIDGAGWLHSGDLGVMDEDGYLRITGRLKEMIVRGGEKIYPAEIEACLGRHPKVAQAAVFGVADPKWGEEVGAWVQPHEGVSLSAAEVRACAREGLAHYKVPRDVRIVAEFPLTITGKIQKFRIRERVEAEMRAGTAPELGDS